MQDVSSWSILVDKISKEVKMAVTGSFTPERAVEFVQDYKKKIDPIKADEFILTLDCKGLDLVKSERVQDLKNCYLLYKESGFKKVRFEIEKNVVMKMQLNRLARETGLTVAEVVEL